MPLFGYTHGFTSQTAGFISRHCCHRSAYFVGEGFEAGVLNENTMTCFRNSQQRPPHDPNDPNDPNEVISVQGAPLHLGVALIDLLLTPRPRHDSTLYSDDDDGSGSLLVHLRWYFSTRTRVPSQYPRCAVFISMKQRKTVTGEFIDSGGI